MVEVKQEDLYEREEPIVINEEREKRGLSSIEGGNIPIIRVFDGNRKKGVI